jgi:Arc/MetJ-type ribon-helix-helix transcriptional regulator
MDSGNKDLRVITPMTAELVEAIDDWRFANRIATRSEAIRRLLRLSLDAAAKVAPLPKRQARRSA